MSDDTLHAHAQGIMDEFVGATRESPSRLIMHPATAVVLAHELGFNPRYPFRLAHDGHPVEVVTNLHVPYGWMYPLARKPLDAVEVRQLIKSLEAAKVNEEREAIDAEAERQ